MAATNFKPEFTVCKTESDAFTSMIENRELIRKNSARRLHGNPPNAAPIHPRAETPQDSAACCELYARIDMKYLLLGGDWLTRAGFINGMRYAGKNPRHERLHCDYATAYKRIMGMPGRYERGEYK